MDKRNIWVVDDDESIRWVLERGLSENGIDVETFDSANKVIKKLETENPQLILTDIKMPGKSGIDLLDEVKELRPDIPIIIMTAHSDLESAVESYEHGAWEYLPKPFDIEEAISMVKRATSRDSLQPEELQDSEAEVIGEAPAMQEVFRAIGKLSNSNSTVLLIGQSGTGKELVAKALFQHSPRKDKPFIALNMADIPKDLLESELFGHEKGAFTGADERRIGRFEQANDGTLFLDEIGDMPLETQTRLLRVLSNSEFYRVGGTEPIRVDVRIITATHQNLEDLVKRGEFREDLFHRLNVIKLSLPKLNERKEDIPSLAKHFFKKSSEELKEEKKYLSEEVENYFMTLSWPGNVRQLENTCRWLTVMSPSKEVRLEDLPDDLKIENTKEENNWQKVLKSWSENYIENGHSNILEEVSPEFERTLINVALNKTKGRKKEAAELLGWGRNTLARKIKDLGIED
ncbi:MAG: nitrogen regulation protein NR(I) [Gammaproteobacteria bacterium]|jgi:two-component system nitrogen regulation response regulator GlnG|nr:nitrogen regulation protein NR(I) [Gammaproteobacteria bacterium]HJL95792.1 nitrogen regulation protein NR(I) [SAR86 cluster bacterium]|tara:strand:+ start:15639 stop:17021 length:1383 start_codon:yes stop_codon:yes gene_type:complete